MDKTIKIFNLQSKQQLHHFVDAHTGNYALSICLFTYIDGIMSVTVSKDSKLIVSGSADKSIKVFDIHSKQQVHHFVDAHSGTSSTLTFIYLP